MSSITKNDKSNKSPNKTKILSDNYLIIKKIGAGSFGEVFLAQNTKNGHYVAAKIEEKARVPRIYNEYKIYCYLHKKNFDKGLPKIYDFLGTADYNIMFMQLLGPSLEDLFNQSNRGFKFHTVANIALNLITLLEKLHNAEFIHRDIKPNNFLVDKDNQRTIYIMDFGLSKKYIIDNKHIKYRDKRSLIGTARYASINMHMGIEPTRRDDLESLGYMLIYFIKGSLPWQGIKRKPGNNNLESIGECKICTSIDTLCENLPSCFKEYITYTRSLKYDETPNYEYLRNIFSNKINEIGITTCYEWC